VLDPSVNMRGGKNKGTPQIASSSSFFCLALSLVEFRLKVVVFGYSRFLRSTGMGSSQVLNCNTRLFVIELTYSYLYLHDLSPTRLDIGFMISLLCNMFCMIRQLALVH